MSSSDEVLVTWKVTEETTYQARVDREVAERMNADGDLSPLSEYEGDATNEIDHESEREITETEGLEDEPGFIEHTDRIANAMADGR